MELNPDAVKVSWRQFYIAAQPGVYYGGTSGTMRRPCGSTCVTNDPQTVHEIAFHEVAGR